jgi:SSS family solute:Na+ symporter
MRIGTIDVVIIVVYLAGVTLFGATYGRSQRTIRDYFLGGRTAPWWALACSIVATETSTLTIIGTPAIAYATNLEFLQLVMGYVVARVILCIILIPQYFRGEFYTAYQLLERRFGTRTKSVAASIFVVTRALAEGVRFAAIGKVVSILLGTGDRVSVAVITLLTLFYTFQGGMRAVIWTDVMQFCLYIAGSVVAFFLLLHRIPSGWTGVVHAAAAGGDKLRVFDFHFSLTQSYTFWSGLIGGTFLTMASHGTDQTMVQRLLAAKSERDSKKALLASGVIVFVQFLLFLLIGVMLYVYRQYIPFAIPGGDADRIFPEFIVTQMPVGLVGIVLAAIFAMAMSNASGSLNSLASSSMIDFSLARGVDINDSARQLRRSRLWTIFWGVLLGLFGMIRWGPVLVAGLTIASITYGSLLGTFLLVIWNPRATARGAIAGMIAGLIGMTAIHFYTPLAWTWYVLAGTIITFAVSSAVSMTGRRDVTTAGRGPEFNATTSR